MNNTILFCDSLCNSEIERSFDVPKQGNGQINFCECDKALIAKLEYIPHIQENKNSLASKVALCCQLGLIFKHLSLSHFVININIRA